MKKNIFYFALFFLVNFSCFADCKNILRLEVAKRLGRTKLYLLGEYADSYHLAKEKLLLDIMQKYADKESLVSKRANDNSEINLLKILDSNYLSSELKLMIKAIRAGLFSISTVKDWVSNLYKDVVVEIYANRSFEEILEFDTFNEVDEKIIIQVLLDRLSLGGFSNDLSEIEYLKRDYSENDFSNVLKQKKLIIDNVNRGTYHGHLVHLFQIDFVMYMFKKVGIKPSETANFYAWMGTYQVFEYDNSTVLFNPHIDVWEALFDSAHSDLTSPEEINPVLMQYFKLFR